jgi:hypothetical protein
MNDIDSLARRLVSRIWNALPQERRNPEELRAEVALRATEAAGAFKPGQNPYARLRETYPNAGKPWKRTEDEELRRLFAAGNSIEDLMLLFGRTSNGVQQRLITLGALPGAAA